VKTACTVFLIFFIFIIHGLCEDYWTTLRFNQKNKIYKLLFFFNYALFILLSAIFVITIQLDIVNIPEITTLSKAYITNVCHTIKDIIVSYFK
jgi:hypothetical protein